MRVKKSKVDFIVIGSGIAGLRTAIGLSRFGKVRIFTKASINMGSSIKAQGGVAVVLSPDDRFEYHIEDTLRAGAGLCDERMVKILVEEGPARIMELVEWGVRFDIYNGQFLLSLEGAHSHRRIIHAMGDATGKEIERALIIKATSIENIEVFDRCFSVELLSDSNTVYGVLWYNERSRELEIAYARAIVLATGGVGQVYKNTTNPYVSTGDGIGLAYRAGAEIRDMEFIQFHPTALYVKGKKTHFLISEAVRGAGAILRNAPGERFMLKYDERGELASRDIVSRAIFNEMRKFKTNYVYLDVRHLNKSDFARRFPNIYKELEKHHIDIKKDLIPVCPSAHFSMGGIVVDEHGRTNLKKLFAVGEVASNGVHGANRLASNSLLECLVFGHRTAEYIGQAHFGIESAVEPPSLWVATRKMPRFSEYMEKYAGIVRHGTGLKTLLRRLEEAKNSLQETEFSQSIDWRKEYEYLNKLLVAYAIAQGGIMREESRGAHYRADFPAERDEFIKHYIIKRDQEFWR